MIYIICGEIIVIVILIFVINKKLNNKLDKKVDKKDNQQKISNIEQKVSNIEEELSDIEYKIKNVCNHDNFIILNALLLIHLQKNIIKNVWIVVITKIYQKKNI